MTAIHRFVVALVLTSSAWLAVSSFISPRPSLAQSAAAPQSTEGRANGAAEQTDSVRTPQSRDEDWAAEYLQDPLAAAASPTLEMLEAALADPNRWSRVLEEHFPRAAELTLEQQRAFLQQALEHPATPVRQQAAAELQRRGWLESWLAALLQQLVDSEDEDARRAALIGLGRLPAAVRPDDQAYVDTLIAAVDDPSPEISRSAREQLIELGPGAVPGLLDAWRTARDTDDARLHVLTEVMAAVVAGKPDEPFLPEARAAPSDFWESPLVAPGKGQPGPVDRPDGRPVPVEVRLVDDQSPTQVRVYYGTNRQSIAASRLSAFDWVLHLGLVLLVVIGSLMWGGRRVRAFSSPTPPRRSIALLLLLGWAVVGLWSWPTLKGPLRRWRSDELSVHYGGRRSHEGKVYYGYCDVSIPPTHQVGAVEAPLVGPEDEARHVVLKAVEQWEADYFFEQIRALLQERSHEMGCFVFVHGYNVSFQDAAKRTAQIFYDLEFQGVPIFYSWPSRGGVRHYFSDRNEVQFSRELLREFLIDVVERSEAKRVHVIAHSMGADAVSQAIAAIDTDRRIFDQIILAAPDIDADVFRRQLLPRLDGRSLRTTLYCSRNDLALHMSYLFNDSPRVGDSSRGLLFDPSLDTVDASFIDMELLGHSYYGSCLPVLRDVARLLADNAPPPARNLVSRPGAADGSIWTFPELWTD